MTAKSALAELKRLSSKKYRDGMARYGLPVDRAMGVPVGAIQTLGKRIGKHKLVAWLGQIVGRRVGHLVKSVGNAG